MAEKPVKPITSQLLDPFSSMRVDQQIRLTFNQDRPDWHEDDDSGLLVDEARPTLHVPPRYKVVMYNDDYTPMDFVVEALERFFALNREQATRIMLAVHTEGRAVCGVFTRDIAETKAEQVNEYARTCQHPLLCETEKDG